MGISQGGGGQGTIFTEINITPLTDIFLVLLIIMMVIAPMFQNVHKEIQMPKIQAGDSIDESHTVLVEVSKQGAVFVNGTSVPDPSLTATLQSVLSLSPEKRLTLRADKDTQSKDVMRVFHAASEAGFERLVVAGEPLTGERAETLEDNLPKEATP